MVTRILDITAMTFSKRMKFREYLFTQVAPTLDKVKIVKNHASFPIVEIEFETDEEADHFINTLLAASTLLKSYLALREGKGIRFIHSTKYDRMVIAQRQAMQQIMLEAMAKQQLDNPQEENEFTYSETEPTDTDDITSTIYSDDNSVSESPTINQ